jgi:hypothetical protein
MAVFQAGMVTQAPPQLLRFYLDRGPGERYRSLMITNGGGGPSFFWLKAVQRL